MNRKSEMILLLLIIIFAAVYTPAQSIPKDSLFLGQTPPGLTPKVFKLEVTPGTFAAERIAISKDGSEIFYSEIKNYYPIEGAKTRYYKFQNNKWSGSNILFEGYAGPALSLTEDTLFIEREFRMYYSVRQNSGWSNPTPFFNNIKSAHYLQVTNKGNYFVSANSAGSVGRADWSKIEIKGKDTTAISFGFPVNRVVDDQDFYIAKDESYMIVCPNGPMGISYPGKNGVWSNGRHFNNQINFGLNSWGAFVTQDNKYLFYTSGTKPDYSDVYVYWLSMGNMIDSLKNTNLPPYVKNLPAHQTAKTGEVFIFTIPNDAVCDDDGDNLRYEVLSLDGSAMPKWLNFDPKTNTLTGVPETAGKITLRVNAFDNKGVMTAFGLVINVMD